MAFVIGAYARSAATPLRPQEVATLRRALRIGPMDTAGFTGTSRLQFAWVDLDGSVGAPQECADGSLSLVWGALYCGGREGIACQSLLQRESRSERPALADISGEFGFAFHDVETDSLQLVTDKLGIRPLFVHCTADRVWFSSSLRAMERLPCVPRVMDFRAATEMAFFGAPLSDRTPYLDVRVLRAGERLRVDARRVRSDYYWRWNVLPEWRGDRAGSLVELAARFRTSVGRRRGGDARVLCLLSGGLDSRMIACALREQGTEVIACNFSPPGTQDEVYSREVAQALGCEYSWLPLEQGHKPNFYVQLSEACRAGAIDGDGPIDRPHWVFIGMGGGAAVAPILHDEEIFGHFRAGRIQQGLERYAWRRGWRLVEHLYRPDVLGRMRDVIIEGVHEHFREFPCDDAARGFHLFEMLNDQRRHLHAHWDDAVVHGMQFHVPYLDSQFLEQLLSIPIDWTLHHDLYHSWMEHFDPAARSVPWQVYPGHRPCPVPSTRKFPTQWEESAGYVLSNRAALTASLGQILGTRPFPALLNRNYLRLVRVRRALGGDYGYAIGPARTLRDVWVQCEGRGEWR